MTTIIKIGILSVEQQRKRVMDIASGNRKRGQDEPKIYFPSIAAAVKILATDHIALARAIRE
ncbi:MAG: hypothetical protein JWM30_1474 [Burkholderia sp.]|jgi:predicted transcriptional regulator|nr:hypothetical protein [Burkholderia sp.]